jgi:hypothetical protein
MDYETFSSKWNEFCEKTKNDYDMKIGNDMSINTRITIDENGDVWVRAYESFKRVKTTVNLKDVVEFRWPDYREVPDSFYIICNDYSGFEVEGLEIYYCIDGQPSGDGSATEHFANS